MSIIESLAALESNHELHEARLLVLLAAFAGEGGTGEVEGLTKLAKLDFLLRYPVMLQRALDARKKSTAKVKILPHEIDSVESRMVRYRFGPWDHQYREFLNVLVAKDLAHVRTEGRKVTIGLTSLGLKVAREIAMSEYFQDIARRADLLKAGLDLSATNLMRFIYQTFPELSSLRMNEAINT